MANIRRNQNLRSVLSNVKNKVEALEGARGSAITASSVSAISSITPDDEDPTPPDLPAGANKRYEFKRVLKAYIYGSKVTGNTPRLELYFSEDPEIAQADFVNVQSINGTSTDDFGISPKNFRVFAIDSAPWDDDVRATQPWRNTPSVGNNGETITNTVWFNPVVEVPITYSSTSGRELITTRRIESVSATGSTVTVTLNSTHLFNVSDIISVDLVDQLYGIDGLFVITAVPANDTIVYELDAPLGASVSLTGSALGTKYVYPVARNYVPDGQVWIDTSVTPNRVWVWNTLRWYDTADPIGDVAAVQDGIAPSPVTSLTGTSELPTGATSPVLNLAWTPPTTRSDGATISGFLDGYDIWYKRSTEVLWKKEFVKDGGEGVNTHQIKDAILLQNLTYNIRVYTVDIMGQYSVPATVNVLTARFSEVLNAPSKPTVSSRLGTITVNWDGNDSTGGLPVAGVLYVEVHRSTATGFTPSTATLVSTVPNNIGGDYVVLSDLDYGVNYFFKLVFVRQISPFEVESSDPSVQSDAIQVARLVNTDLIANTISGANIQSGTITASDKIIGNTITGALIQALTIEAGNIRGNAIEADKIAVGAITGSIIEGKEIRTALSGARVELRNTGIYAFSASDPTNPTFAFNTSTSTLTIGGYATTGDISNFIEGSEVNANVTSISGGVITTGTINANVVNVTNINAGNITVGTLNVTRIGSGTLPAGVIYAGTINADNINAGTLSVTRIGSGTLPAGVIYAGTINADNINAGTLTGRVVRTSGSAGEQRLSLNTDGRIVFFRAGNAGTPDAEIRAGDTNGNMTIRVPSGSSTGINLGAGGLTVIGGGNITAGGDAFAGGRMGAFNLRTTSVRFVTTLSDQTGFTQLGGIVSSDARLKNNIETTSLGLNFINDLNPVEFEFTNKEAAIDNGTQFGVIAQELKATLGSYGVGEENGIVYKAFYGPGDDDYHYAVSHHQLVSPLIKAVQELSQKNDELQARLATLEGTT